MKQKADRHRRDAVFAVGDRVLLSVKNLQLKHPGSKKLLLRFIGPYKVVKVINPVAVQLELPPALRVHPVFHVSLLRKYEQDPGRGIRPPPPIEVNGSLQLEVEAVLSHHTRATRSGDRTRYLVQYKGYGPEHNAWLPEASLAEAQEAIADYWATVRAREHMKQARAQKAARSSREAPALHALTSADLHDAQHLPTHQL